MMLTSARKSATQTRRNAPQMGNAALCVFVCVCLTDHEAHEFVRQDAGADESHPQADVKFPGALRLHPHKQADEGKQTQTSVKRALIKYNHAMFCPYFFIFSNTSAILPKRFWKERISGRWAGDVSERVNGDFEAASYLCFLCNVQNELELLRDSQVFLWRLLSQTRREVTGLPGFPLTQKQEENRTMGSETSGTMLHWILQPLEHRKNS